MACLIPRGKESLSFHMYLDEHPPPHVHVKKGNSNVGVIEIKSLKIEGDHFKHNERKYAKSVVRVHRRDFLRARKNLDRGKQPRQIKLHRRLRG